MNGSTTTTSSGDVPKDAPETLPEDKKLGVCNNENAGSDAKKEFSSGTPEFKRVGKGDVDGDEEEVADEEEAMLAEMEKEKEKASAEVPANSLSRDIGDAPTLLRAALKSGEVTNENSNVEDGKKVGQKDGAASPKHASDSDREEKKSEELDSNAAEQKVSEARWSQLDFLLNKASEYSSFIANDIEELQQNLQQKAEREEKKGKKRKSKGGGKGSKRAKTNEGEAALKSAQEKDAKLRASDRRPIFVQPTNLSSGCVLKDYQLEGVRWLVSLFENGVSGILADEMGLGKTIQVIAMVAHLLTQNVSGPFLVVAPLATLPNWMREFQKWLPNVKTVRYHGSVAEREAFFRGPLNPKLRRQADFPIIITSYEVAIRDRARLERLGEFQFLIVDEGQRLKNHRCTLIQSLKRLKSHNRLLLSGTPIQNNLDELWSLLNFVNPQIFDDLSVFQSWFGFRNIGQRTQGATDEATIKMEQKKNRTISKLHEILRPFLLRRVKRDVLLDLPPKKEVIVYSGMSKLQVGYANLIEQGVLRNQLIEQGIEMGRTLSQTNKQMNHRINVNHPFLFGEPIDGATGAHLGTAHPHLLIRASGKFALLDRMLDRLFKDKHQVLIFSQMTSLLNVIEDYLVYRHWKYCRIDGSTNVDERQRQMDIFNAEKTKGKDGGRNEGDDRHFVFLLSTRAGGLGINLTCADTCIIFDSDFNPHQDSQAMDRCHRIGQTRPVAVYRLITANSVDIDMMEKQISKKKLERMTIAGGEFKKPGKRHSGQSMSFAELDALLQDDVKDLHHKGGDVENVKISDEEFDKIMNRKSLFAEGEDSIPSEGKMYDVIDNAVGDVLGSMMST